MKKGIVRTLFDRARSNPVRTVCLITGASLVALAPEIGLAAQSVGDIARNVSGSLEGVGKLITGGSYVGGMGLGAASMLKFKAHKDNPQQTPLGTPIMMLAVAAGLLFLPSVFSTGGQTIFGGQQAATGVQGSTGGAGGFK